MNTAAILNHIMIIIKLKHKYVVVENMKFEFQSVKGISFRS